MEIRFLDVAQQDADLGSLILTSDFRLSTPWSAPAWRRFSRTDESHADGRFVARPVGQSGAGPPHSKELRGDGLTLRPVLSPVTSRGVCSIHDSRFTIYGSSKRHLGPQRLVTHTQARTDHCNPRRAFRDNERTEGVNRMRV